MRLGLLMNLKDIRTSLSKELGYNLTQDRLGKTLKNLVIDKGGKRHDIGYTASYINRVENGKLPFSNALKAKIADTYGLKICWDCDVMHKGEHTCSGRR